MSAAPCTPTDAAPELKGYHHVTLTVSDLERTLEWYTDVLGFDILGRAESDGMTKALARRGSVTLTFVDHGEQSVDGPFSERRCGLDHLAFAVADRAALDEWVTHLEARGIEHNGVVAATLGQLVSFRDPDGIALELYTLS